MTAPSAWRPLSEAPHATYYTSRPGHGGDVLIAIHWDAAEARSAASDAFADLHHGDLECDAEEIELAWGRYFNDYIAEGECDRLRARGFFVFRRILHAMGGRIPDEVP